MKMIKGIVLAALVTLPVVGFANSGSDTNVVWKKNLGLGATYKDGNTEKSLFTMNLKGERYADKSDWVGSLYGEHGKTESQDPTTGVYTKNTTEGQLRAQSDYRYKFGSERFYGGIFAEAYYDDIKLIRTRAKLGPNIGYYLIHRDNMKLDVSIGLNYVYERTVTSEADFGEYRAAANYLWDFSETASYYLNIEYSADVEDTDNGSGLLVTGLKSKVSTQLSMFVELRDEYDNIPSEGIEHNDVTIIAGLSYDF